MQLYLSDEPEAAAREFERCINDLGFKGALIMGRAQDGFLDQDKYDIIFKTAENLERTDLSTSRAS